MDVRICLFGATGRMGAEIAVSVKHAQDAGKKIAIVAGVGAPGEPAIGKTLPGIQLPISSEFEQSFTEANIIVDFSGPGGTIKALEAAYQHKLPILVGTTGLPESYQAIFQKVSTVAPVIRTTNTSVGVNVLTHLVREAARMFPGEVDIEIIEAHHRMKKDAPSGTALSLGEAAASARGSALENVMETDRSKVKAERKQGSIGIQAVRGGDVVGEHTVFFLGDGERVELTHRATKRSVFADGAVRAAAWLVARAQQPGVYTMFDVLS